jgi:riboflavin kinase/FMN adenylyltransferase
MKAIKNLADTTPELKGSIITIGNFDGIHLGHRKIFKRVIEESKRYDRKSVVITFEPHPKKVIHPERRPFFILTPAAEKLSLIEMLGIDTTILISFTREFAQTTAKEFVTDILWKKLQCKKMVIGYDYKFGKDKGGNADFLRKWGMKLGFQVEQIAAIKMGDKIVSSTNIRLAILDGNVTMASQMLGRPYNVKGIVTRGYHRGTEIGYPTANIESEKVIPATGVYAIIAEFDGKRHQGVINIGYCPTFGNEEITAEVHILDFHGDIYGKEMEVSFIDRIRDELTFESPEKLREQIQHDITRAKVILAPHVTELHNEN